MTFGELLVFGIMGAAGCGMLYLCLRAAIEIATDQDVRQRVLEDLYKSPLRALVTLCLVLGTTGFLLMTPLGLFGYEPELFETGWRIWSICTIAMIASVCFLMVL